MLTVTEDCHIRNNLLFSSYLFIFALIELIELPLVFLQEFVNPRLVQLFEGFIYGIVILDKSVCNRVEILLLNGLHLCVFCLDRNHIKGKSQIFLRNTSVIPVFVYFNLLIRYIALLSFDIVVVGKPGLKQSISIDHFKLTVLT